MAFRHYETSLHRNHVLSCPFVAMKHRFVDINKVNDFVDVEAMFRRLEGRL
jgi:hypothetical protein